MLDGYKISVGGDEKVLKMHDGDFFFSTQYCAALCDPMSCSPLGFSVHGLLQARIWSGLPFPSPGDLPDPGIEPGSSALQADSLPTELLGKPLKMLKMINFTLSVLHHN